MTSYKYFLSGSPTYFEQVGQEWKTDFNYNLDYNLSLASDYFTIQEELTFASGSLSDLGCRITTAVDPTTGVKLGDDFKMLLFNSEHQVVYPGYKFYFDSNYWLVNNVTSIKSLTNTSMVRRCNNVLRWVDIDGIYNEEVCSIDYVVSRANNKTAIEDPVIGQGNFATIYCQLNTTTRKIHDNQRFLFGNSDNWTTIKILSIGVKNYMNNMGENNDTSYLLELVGQISFENSDTDDLVNGIADYNKWATGSRVADIVVSPSGSDLNILEEATQIYNVLYYNGSGSTTGSFIFTVNDSLVPVTNYVFSTIDGNNFSVTNNEAYFDSSLNILANGISGSRIISLNLMGAWI